MNDLNLAEFLMKNVGKIDRCPDGYSETMREFWDTIVEPLLPKKETLGRLTDMLVRYCDEPNAIFPIRDFGSRSKRAVEPDKRSVDKKGNSALRRGFLSHTEFGFSIFYTDNYFAHYFQKMALNDYVPNYEEFKTMMLTHEFPGRFGPFDTNYELKKATFDIAGKKGKDPGYGDAGYKLSHIFDAGRGYWLEDEGRSVNRAEMCQKFFPRGQYEDWQRENGTGNYVRYLKEINEGNVQLAKKWLEAQFLRLACPLNYVLTPLEDSQIAGVELEDNDIGEVPKFQKYAMYRFEQKYGDLFERYCSYLMLEPGVKGVDYGEEIIKLEYSSKILEQRKKEKEEKKGNKILTSKNIRDFLDYITRNTLSHRIIDLMDEDYCENEIGILKPVFAEKKGMFEIRKTWSKDEVEMMSDWLSEELCYVEDAEDEEEILIEFLDKFHK